MQDNHLLQIFAIFPSSYATVSILTAPTLSGVPFLKIGYHGSVVTEETVGTSTFQSGENIFFKAETHPIHRWEATRNEAREKHVLIRKKYNEVSK